MNRTMNAYHESWYTQEDILKDLAVSGNKVNDFRRGIIIGNQPPPPLHTSEDEEALLLFGNDYNKVSNEIIEPPDLKGITEMIRMVQDHDTSSNHEAEKITLQDSSEVDIISISKLNPNVSEFVPKAAMKQNLVPKKEPNKDSVKNVDISANSLISIKDDVITNVDRICINKNQHGSKNNVKSVSAQVDCDLGTSSLEPEHRRNISAHLKSKIINASEENTMKNKRERNVAIAALIKLHSTSPNISPKPSLSKLSTLTTNPPTQTVIEECTNSSSKAIKLFTPDYFEHSCSGPVLSETNNNQEIIIDKLIKKPLANPIKADEESHDINGTSVTTADTLADNTPDGQIKESIDKVNEWLNKPEVKVIDKGPTIFLGPVTFKRKDISAKSPVNDVNKKTAKIQENVFVPSSYATELAKSYMERNRLREATKEDIWTNVTKKLKEKDEKLKQKMTESRESSEVTETEKQNPIGDDSNSSN